MAAVLQPTTAPQTFNSGISENTGGSASITVDAGSDRVMLVTVHGEGDGSATQAQVSALTYGGVALTLVQRVERSDWSWVEMWRLIAPAVGAATLSLTISEVDQWTVTVLVGQGVDQVTPLRTPATQSGSATSASATPAGVTANDLVVDALTLDATGHNPVQGADQTERFDLDALLGGYEMAVSTQLGSAGGAMTYSWTTSCPFSYVATAFIGATGGGGAQTVTVPLVDAAAAVYAPVVTPGAVSVSAPLVDAGAAVFSPTLSPGAVTVTAPLVDAGAAIFEPSVTPDGATVAPPLVDAGAAVFAPTLTPGAATIAPPLVDSGAVVHAPSVVLEGAAVDVSVRPRLGAG